MAEGNATKEERASTEEKSPLKDGNNNNNGNQSSKSNSKDPSRPRRKKARRACFACQRAHLTCGKGLTRSSYESAQCEVQPS